MSWKYKVGTVVGIILGVTAGHTIMNRILSPSHPPVQYYQEPIQMQPGVFEQALTLPVRQA